MSASTSQILTSQKIDSLIKVYRDGLFTDVLPFWINHCVDRQNGGFMFSLDQDGTVIDTDKSIWIQGRFSWLLATLYKQVEPNNEWLDLSRHGIEFLRKFGFDRDGRMFFLVTQDGKPLRKRRYIFSEAFTVSALAAYGSASGDEKAKEEALELFRKMDHYLTTPGILPPKLIPETRQLKGLAVPMIMINTAQNLREAVDDPICDKWIDRSISEIQTHFMKQEFKSVLESVGIDGEFFDHFDGRMVCPGHSMEAAWFILKEARYRQNDPELIKLGTTILDWMWEQGWDEEYGGIFYFRDVKGLPVQEYWHDMKFWWPHNESIIATLLAYQLTGSEKYAEWHQQVHNWAYRFFPDPKYGEWFGYLHRDGRLSSPIKGNWWKGPFHLPRMQLTCWKILEELKQQGV